MAEKKCCDHDHHEDNHAHVHAMPQAASASHCHDHGCCSGHSHQMPSESTQLYAQLQNFLKFNREQEAPKSKKSDFKFWSTQPVPDFDDSSSDNKPIENDKPISDIRAEPFALPGQFVWDDIDLSNESQLNELYQLLYENYVEDDDHLFRFDYSREFLQWAIKPPGWHPEWHCGIRSELGAKPLVGFIAAIPSTVSIHGTEKKIVEINFLCVHKKLRSKRMAPVLIKEITRRVNRRGIFQAVYTSGTQLPRPVATSRYWHRPLNPAKLVDCRFSSLRPNMTKARMVKLYKLKTEFPALPEGSQFKPLEEKHIGQAFAKLCDHQKHFKIHQKFTKDEFRHWFLPRENIVNTYVVLNGRNQVTDMCSFYTLPSTVFNCQKYNSLKSAYAFYYFNESTSLELLMECVLIAAKALDYDVFNALDLMNNEEFLEKLKFGGGDGNLRYYIYNWLCPVIKPKELALIFQ